jgi:hypothetical protein
LSSIRELERSRRRAKSQANPSPRKIASEAVAAQNRERTHEIE